MKIVALIAVFILCSCAQKPKSKPWPDKMGPQDSFYMGCMNAYLSFTITKTLVPVKQAHDWCENQWKKVRDR